MEDKSLGSIKNIGIFCKQKPRISNEVLEELTQWLRKKGLKVFMADETAAIIGETSSLSSKEIPPKVDLIIVLGGDGTLLSVARLSHLYKVPLLAVNLGSLGFLTEVSLSEMYQTLERILNGESTIENRMLLKGSLSKNGDLTREDFALNDVVINKSAARIVNLEVLVNYQYMTSYRADGLIIATPTGSTAYSLSAGGPIMHPRMHALLLCPICPFALTNRPIVIPDDSTIQIKITTEEEVQVTLDGQVGYKMYNNDILEVKKSPNPISLILAPGKNYYEILRKKLHWGRFADEQKNKKN